MPKALAAILLAASAAFSQSSTGTLTGIVTDQTQGNLPGVAIELVNSATGVAERGVTNGAGEYTFPLLQPGAYTSPPKPWDSAPTRGPA